MTSLLHTSLGRLRVVAFLEGVSFLILLGIAMPLKYMADMPAAVRVVGMAHGVLFIAYVICLYLVWDEHRWSIGKAFLAFVASLIPFGTFYADKKWFRG
jgi:integral membrane protein